MKIKNTINSLFLFIFCTGLALGQEQTFESNGINISYIEKGEGEPVILVHGYLASAQMNWVTPGVYGRLSKKFHVIALDCRGFGNSGKPHSRESYGLEMPMDIVRLMDHLEIEKAHIVGYSMGGMITAKLLTMKPDRFLSATIAGTGAILDPSILDLAAYELTAESIQGGSLQSMGFIFGSADKPGISNAEIHLWEQKLLKGQDLRACSAVAGSLPKLAISSEQLAAVEVPTLSIMGRNDPLMISQVKLKKAMPQLEVVYIENAEHMNAPAFPKFSSELIRFLSANSQLVTEKVSVDR